MGHFRRVLVSHGVSLGALTGVSNMAPSAICDVFSVDHHSLSMVAIGGLYSNLSVALNSFFDDRVFSGLRRRVE